MTAANYAACYAITRAYEGGNDDDPRDPGGRTSRGVIQREYDKYRAAKGNVPADVWKASEDEIADIYRTNYWNAVLGDNWPAGPDLVVWDCAVNSGPARSKSIAAACLNSQIVTWTGLASLCAAMTDTTGFIKDACKKRLSFLQGLKTFATFGKGWSRRVASVEANAVRMALNAADVPAPEIKKKLETEAGQAKTQANKHAGGAATSGGGGAVGGNQDWSSMDWTQIVTIGAVIALCIIAAIFFIHWYRAHNERAKAYAAVAAVTGG